MAAIEQQVAARDTATGTRMARGAKAAAVGRKAAKGAQVIGATRRTGTTRGTGTAQGKAPAGKARTAGKSAAKKSAAKPAQKPALPTASGAAARQDPSAGAKPKQKLVRDSFTMPKQDFALIEMLKDRMVAYKRPTRKSELLRAGLHALMALPDAKLGAALDGLVPLKAGRPRKDA